MSDPKKDPRYLAAKQVHYTNRKILERAKFAEMQCKETVRVAERALLESDARLELISEELDIVPDACEHQHLDDRTCLDCGKDMTEDLAAQAYDRAKDQRKYGG